VVSPEKVTPVAWDEDRIRDLLPSVDANPWGPLESARDVFYGGHLYEYTRAAERALMVVRPVQLAHGTRLDVIGLASLADRLNSAAVVASLESLAHQHGAQQLAMCTQRQHLVKSCTRLGWQVTGQVLTKALHVQ
jgi:hypothetical protein